MRYVSTILLTWLFFRLLCFRGGDPSPEPEEWTDECWEVFSRLMTAELSRSLLLLLFFSLGKRDLDLLKTVSYSNRQ